MLLRCTKAFETREYGFPQTIEEGTVWYRRNDWYVPGGYEVCDMILVEDGRYTTPVRIRLSRLQECFEQIPLKDYVGLPVPPEQALGGA